MNTFALIAILTIIFLLIVLGEQMKLKKEVRKLKRLVNLLKNQIEKK